MIGEDTGFLSAFDVGDCLVMIKVHADAAGHEASTPIVSVAALMAEKDQWTHFERHWGRVLADYGITEFHMTDYEARRKPYNLPNPRRIELIQRLIGVIATRVDAWTYALVNIEDHRQRFHDRPDALRPYGWGVTGCAVALLRRLKERQDGLPLHFVFEQGDTGWGEVQRVFQELRDTTDLAADVAFAAKKVMPLQAADLCAYESFKHGLSHVIGSSYKRPFRKSFGLLLERKPPCFVHIFDKRGFEEFTVLADV